MAESKQCAFTICTRSYRSLAYVLRDSFLQFNKDYDFYIVLVDGDKEECNENELSANEILSNYIEKKNIRDMEFKYSITEFSTSIKPYALDFFLKKNYELALYFDPDIQFFSEFQEVQNESKHIYLTPHIIEMQEKFTGEDGDRQFLAAGIYNCGFIGVRSLEKSRNFLRWWMNRLFDQAYFDIELGLFTDQKWIDFIPLFFSNDELCIIKNYGCNLAPWNFYEREIIKHNGLYYVHNRENKKNQSLICFIHFSGYNYKELLSQYKKHKSRTLDLYTDVIELVEKYGQLLNEYESKNNNFKIKYKYGYFDNGKIITLFHRRLYRDLLENKKGVMDPFSSVGTFYKVLKRKRMITEKVDATTESEIANYSRKQKYLDIFLKLLFKVMKFDVYIEFLRGMHKSTRFEHQNQVFNFYK